MSTSASRTAFLYAALAGLMVMIDLIIDSLAHSGQIMGEMHVLFAVSAMLLLYFFLSRELRARARAEARHRLSEQRLASLLDSAVRRVYLAVQTSSAAR